MTSTYKTGGARRLIFTGNVKTNLFNKYTTVLNRNIKIIIIE